MVIPQVGGWDLDPEVLVAVRAVPQCIEDALGLGKSLSTLGKAAFEGIRAYAEQHNIQIEGLPTDPNAEILPEQALPIVHNFLAIYFPQLARMSAPQAPPDALDTPTHLVDSVFVRHSA